MHRIYTCAVVCLFSLSLLAQDTLSQKLASVNNIPPPATVTGSGTTDYIPKWTGSTTLGNSILFQTGSKIGVGTTMPSVALDVDGRVNVSKTYRIGGIDVLTVIGTGSSPNTGVGNQALMSLTTSGFGNTAVGEGTLSFNVSGYNNTAAGAGALDLNKSNENTAVGSGALAEDIGGTQNTALGSGAMLFDNGGVGNTALGYDALTNNSNGSSNIAIGYQAALNVSPSNSNNIHIGNTGQSTDSGAVRIGDLSIQTSFFVAGVSGVPTGVNDAVPVLIDTHGQLGTINSSRRFKQDIHDMAGASEGLMHLRPVTFRYTKPFDDGARPIQYGLIAEEVAEVYPDLVTHSSDGQVQAVKYQVLDSMLLNEMQRQQKEIQRLQERLARLEQVLASAERVTRSDGRWEKVMGR